MVFLFYIFIISIIFLQWSLIEARLFKVKHIKFKNAKLHTAIKIVFISDIHYGSYFGKLRLRKIIERIDSMSPDVLIIGGDYLDNTKKAKIKLVSLNELFHELSNLNPRYEKIAVLGNHEYYFKKDLDKIIKKIEDSGIKLLRNETYSLKVGKDIISIHGMDDMEMGEVNLSRLQVRRDALNIIVSHNPDFFEDYDMDYDIGLSGHTHGGQVTLFGLYAPVTESRYGQKYIKRINRKKNSIIITTKGLGCSMLPIRFFATSDIIELVISKK